MMAVNAVKHAGFGLHEAAKMYIVPYTTLRWRVQNDVEGALQCGRKPVLTKKKEETMMQAIVALSDLGCGLSRKEVRIL